MRYTFHQDQLIRRGPNAVDYQPGDGTAYRVAFSLLDSEDAHALGLAYEPTHVVSLVNFNRCMVVPHNCGELHWSYVAEKLGLSEPSAKAMATLIDAWLSGEAA